MEDPPAPVSLERLEREICELSAHIAAATCRWLLLVAEWDERGGWAEWGVKSCAHWLSWRCGVGLVAAREQVRVARRLREYPLLRQAFATGELSYSKVRALARVIAHETEESLVDLARHATGAQLEKLVRGYHGVLVASLRGAQRMDDGRFLSFSWDDDGCMRLSGKLSAEEGALVMKAIDSAAASESLSGCAPDADARRADALGLIARAALAHDGVQRPAGDPTEVIVHVDVDSLTADEIHSRSELEGGPSLAPETVRRLGCDAAVVRILERDGRPLSVGRRRRTIPPSIRRALRARDGGCRFPGCTHRRYLHAHHIVHWAHGGATSLENLVQLCSYHHRLVHEGGFRIGFDVRRRLLVHRPDGREVPDVPRVRRAAAPWLERRNETHGLAVDAHTCMPLSAGDPCDYGIAVEHLMFRTEQAARAGPPDTRDRHSEHR